MSSRRTPLSPQLAQLASEPPAGPDWIHEIKYDGYRILVDIQGGDVRLFTRGGHDWTRRMPSLAAAFERIGVSDAHFDGEVVCFDSDGVPSFERLQRALGQQRGPVQMAIWDILRISGEDLTRRPLLERKALLSGVVETKGPLLRVEHVSERGAELFGHARQLGLEGIVSKRAGAPYRPGDRSGDWLKTKCTETRPFAVIGFTQRAGALRSLLLAHLDEGEALVYAGRVGVTLPAREVSALALQLRALETDACILERPPASPRARWVRFGLGVQVRSLPWVPGRPLRHATLRGVLVAA